MELRGIWFEELPWGRSDETFDFFWNGGISEHEFSDLFRILDAIFSAKGRTAFIAEVALTALSFFHKDRSPEGPGGKKKEEGGDAGKIFGCYKAKPKGGDAGR